MALVEETAAYLDGPGRQESKEARSLRGARLRDREHAADDAPDAARVLAAVHRAVKEGEMSLAQANKEKNKVKLAAARAAARRAGIVLPERLRGLIARSKKLQDEVRRLDATIHATGSDPATAAIRWSGSSACSSRLRGPGYLTRRLGCSGQTGRAWHGAARRKAARRYSYFLRKPENFFWKRDSRPPRSSSCWGPPVQAGWDLGRCRDAACRPACPRWSGS